MTFDQRKIRALYDQKDKAMAMLYLFVRDKIMSFIANQYDPTI
jgi:hypothetical protein